MGYILPFGVELIEHGVGVGLMARSESDDLKVLRHPFQEADSVRSDGNVGVRC